MRQDYVWCTYMDQNFKASLRALIKVSLLEIPQERRQTPSVSSPSTVVSAEPRVKIGLSVSL
jgi:hypothetical protein